MYHAMRILWKSLFYSLPFFFLFLESFSQMAGGAQPFDPTPGEVKPNDLKIGSYEGNVNLFSGEYNNNINLGTVSTPGGLSYSVNLNYSSKNQTSNNSPHLGGIPYGEGWNVSIPRITVQSVSRRYKLPGREKSLQLKKINFTNDSLADEGEVYYYAPFLEIPGVASGRLILKEIQGSKAIFVLEKFEKYIEASLQSTVWTVKLDDGTTYVFDYMQKRLRAPSNSRLDRKYRQCVDHDTIIEFDTICVGRDSISPGGIPYGNCNDTLIIERMRLINCSSTPLVDLGNPISKELAEVITPKTEIVSWYPSTMYNIRLKNQYINFYYNTYGRFDFFNEYMQNGYRFIFSKHILQLLYGFDSNSISGIMPFLQDTLGGGSIYPYETFGMRENPIKGYYTEIFLKSVVAVDNTLEAVPTQKLELEYGTFDVANYSPGGGVGGKEIGFNYNTANLLLWKNDPFVKRFDSLFNYKIVYHRGKVDKPGIKYLQDTINPRPFYNTIQDKSWSRFRHLRSDEFLYSNPGILIYPGLEYTNTNIFDTWGSQGVDVIATKINSRNPYVSSITPGILGQFYLGHQKAEMNDIEDLVFDHSILESERIKFDAVPGDYYELKTYIRTFNYPWGQSAKPFNIDINIVSGKNQYGFFYLQNNPLISGVGGNVNLGNALGGSMLPAIRTDIPNRQFRIFSTFGNAVKWNVGLHNMEGELVTSNMFRMPNMPNEYEGFHIQIGPGTSDAYYNMGRYKTERAALLNNTSGTTASSFYSAHNAYYTHGRLNQLVNNRFCIGLSSPLDDFSRFFNSIAGGDQNGFMLWDTDQIPQNFGNGQPWYMMDKIMQTARNTHPDPPSSFNEADIDHHRFWWNNTCMPSNGSQPPSLQFVGGKYIPASGYPNLPTWADEGSWLKTVQLIRYAKNPYVLKRAKFYKYYGHYDAFADYLGSNTQDSNLVSIKEFDYDITQSTVANNVHFLSSLNSRLADKTYPDGSLYLRNIFLLKSVTDIPIEDQSSQPLTTEYTYDIIEGLRISQKNITGNLISNPLKIESDNCGTIILLKEVSTPLGGHTIIEYYDPYDTGNVYISNLTTDSPLDFLNTSCNGNTGYNYGPGIRPAGLNKYSLVIPVKFEKKWAGGNYLVKEYQFDSALTDFQVINVDLRKIDANFSILGSRSIFGLSGFEKVTVYEPPLDQAQPELRAKTVYFNFGMDKQEAYSGYRLPYLYCLAGKVKSSYHYDENGILISSVENTYKVTEAYKNYIMRRRILRPAGWQPSASNGDETIYGPVFWPGFPMKYGSYLDLSHGSYCNDKWGSRIKIQPPLVPVIKTGLGQSMKFFESQYGGPPSYFVRLIRKETRNYNQQSAGTTVPDPIESGAALENPYLSTITENNWYDANSNGLSNNPQYKKLLYFGNPLDTSKYIALHDEHNFWNQPEKISWSDGSSPYTSNGALSAQDYQIIDLRKGKSFEPSWQLSSTINYSPQKPGFKVEEEFYYYYDFQKLMRYRMLTDADYSIQNYIPYFWSDPHQRYSPIWFHYFHGFRSSPIQKRKIFSGPTGEETIRDEYYEFDDFKSGIVMVSKTEADTIYQSIPQEYCEILSADTAYWNSQRTARRKIIGPGNGSTKDSPINFGSKSPSIFSNINPLEVDPGGGSLSREVLDNVYQNVAVLKKVLIRDDIQKKYLTHQYTPYSSDSRNEDFPFLDSTIQWVPWIAINIDPFTLDTISADTGVGWIEGVALKTPYSSFVKTTIQGRDRFGRAQLTEDEKGMRTLYHYPKRSYTLFVDPYKFIMKMIDYVWDEIKKEYVPVFGPVPCSYYSMSMNKPGLPDKIIKAYLTPDSLVSRYEYDEKLRVKKIMDPVGAEKEYDYDGLGRLAGEKLNGKQLQTYSYHYWDGLVTQDYNTATGQNYVEAIQYQGANFGLLSRSFVDPLGRNSLSIKNSIDNIATGSISGNSIYSGAIFFDGWGRKIRTHKPWEAGNSFFTYLPNFSTPEAKIRLEGSNRGRALESADFGREFGDGHTTKKSYRILSLSDLEEELNLSSSERDQIAGSNNFGYEFIREKSVDQDGKQFFTYTDAAGLKVAQVGVIDGNNSAITLFIYNEVGELEKVINPIKQNTTYKYNMLGQVYEKYSVDAGISRYLYNRSGSILYEQDNVMANINYGKARGLGYDILGRTIEQSYNNLSTDAIWYHGGTEMRGMAWKNPDLETVVQLEKTEKKWQYGRPIFPVTNVHDKAFWRYTCGERKAGLLNFSASYNNSGEPIEYDFYGYDDFGRISFMMKQFNPTGINETSSGILNSFYYKYNYDGSLRKKLVDINTDFEIDLGFEYRYDRFGNLASFNTGHSDSVSGMKMISLEYDDANSLINRINYFFPNDSLISYPVDSILYSYDPFRDRLKSIVGIYFDWKLYYDDEQVPLDDIYDFSMINPPSNGSFLEQSESFNGNINASLGRMHLGNDPFVSVYGYRYDGINRLIKADGMVNSDFGEPSDFNSEGLDLSQQGLNKLAVGDAVYSYDKIGNFLSLGRSLPDDGPPFGNINHTIAYHYIPAKNHLDYVAETTGINNFSYDLNGNVLTHDGRGISSTTYGRANLPFAMTAYGDLLESAYNVSDLRIYMGKVGNPINAGSNLYYLRDENGKEIGTLDLFDKKWNWHAWSGEERIARISPLASQQPDWLGFAQAVNYANVFSPTALTNISLNDNNFYQLLPGPDYILAVGEEIDAIVDRDSSFSLFAGKRIRLLTGFRANPMLGAKFHAKADKKYYIPVSCESWQDESFYSYSNRYPVDLTYYNYDHLGNVRLTYRMNSGPNGTSKPPVVLNGMFDYFPFGKELRSWELGQERFRFTGKERDSETGIDYFQARNYDSHIGRFLGVDPLMEKRSWVNPFNYVQNNPMIRTDPTGALDWVEDDSGEIYWDENATSQGTTKKGEKFLGKNVLVGTHNRDENGDEQINTATFDLYLETDKTGPSATIEGNTVPADTKAMNTLKEGIYDMEEYGYQKKNSTESRFIIFQKDEKGQVNLNLPTTNEGTMSEVYFHPGNTGRPSLMTSGKVPNPISRGCQCGPSGKGSNIRYTKFMNNWSVRPNRGKYYLRPNPEIK
jgi:RHS repeat-associated protein